MAAQRDYWLTLSTKPRAAGIFFVRQAGTASLMTSGRLQKTKRTLCSYGSGLFVKAAIEVAATLFVVDSWMQKSMVFSPVEERGNRVASCRFGVVGTASPRSWYRCSVYPVLQGVFFHS